MIVRHTEIEQSARTPLDVHTSLVERLHEFNTQLNFLHAHTLMCDIPRTLAACTSPSSSFWVPSSRHCIASTSAGFTADDVAVVDVAHPNFTQPG